MILYLERQLHTERYLFILRVLHAVGACIQCVYPAYFRIEAAVFGNGQQVLAAGIKSYALNFIAAQQAFRQRISQLDCFHAQVVTTFQEAGRFARIPVGIAQYGTWHIGMRILWCPGIQRGREEVTASIHSFEFEAITIVDLITTYAPAGTG